MPEIIEVKKYCDFIKKYIKNEEITRIKILKGRYKKHQKFKGYNIIQQALPLRLLEINSKGKFIYMIFENDIILFCTLGLSGGWVYQPLNEKFIFPNMVEFLNMKDIKNYHNKSLDHLNIEFTTNKGSLYFFDTLSFGTINIVNNKIKLDKKLSNIGPDIMDINTNIDIFASRIKKNSNKIIGLLLLNQKIISGIGNYLRADVLWMSKISPFRLVESLSNKEIKSIYDSIRALTWGKYNYNKAIKLNIIKDNIKLPDFYKRDFFVYYEESDIYGNIVKKEELYEGSQKRFIYWCPDYQF